MEIEQWTATLTESAVRVAVRIMEYLPNMVGAVLLLLLGWGVAKLLRYATRQLFERIVHKLDCGCWTRVSIGRLRASLCTMRSNNCRVA